MTTLIVTLPPTLPSTATPCSAVLSDDGLSVTRHIEAPLSLLPSAPGADIVALVPITQLSWHRVTLPPGTLTQRWLRQDHTARVRKVLDGLLEEHLLDEPEQLHLALPASASAGQPLWVAVCDRAWLAAWLEQLEQQLGRPVARIVPECAPPAEGGHATLYLTGSPEQASLLWLGPQGACALPLSTDSVAMLGDTPPPTDILAEPGVAALAEQYFNGAPVRLQTAPQRAVAAAQSTWDLAQFEFLRTRQARGRKRLGALGHSLWHAPRWRAARWATLALLLVNLVGLQLWSWQEQAALAAKRASMRSLLQATFPEVRVVLDAPLQMERALAELQRQGGAPASGDFETLLGLWQRATPEAAAPSAIDFAAGELRLHGVSQVAPALTATLQAQGYTAQRDGDAVVLKQQRTP